MARGAKYCRRIRFPLLRDRARSAAFDRPAAATRSGGRLRASPTLLRSEAAEAGSGGAPTGRKSERCSQPHLALLEPAHQYDHNRDQHRERRHYGCDTERWIADIEGIMEAERRQHVCGSRWPATRDKIDGREVADCPEGREQRAEQIEVGQQRERDMDEPAVAGRSVNLRRIVDDLG